MEHCLGRVCALHFNGDWRRRGWENGVTTKVPRCKLFDSSARISANATRLEERGGRQCRRGIEAGMADRGVAASQPLAPPGVAISASAAATPVREGGSARKGSSTTHDARRRCLGDRLGDRCGPVERGEGRWRRRRRRGWARVLIARESGTGLERGPTPQPRLYN